MTDKSFILSRPWREAVEKEMERCEFSSCLAFLRWYYTLGKLGAWKQHYLSSRESAVDGD